MSTAPVAERLRNMIRQSVSPGVTGTYARFGFAHREAFIQRLQDPATPANILDQLKSQCILKSRFQHITSTAQLAPYMLKGSKLTMERLGRLGVEGIGTEALFAQTNEIRGAVSESKATMEVRFEKQAEFRE